MPETANLPVKYTAFRQPMKSEPDRIGCDLVEVRQGELAAKRSESEANREGGREKRRTGRGRRGRKEEEERLS